MNKLLRILVGFTVVALPCLGAAAVYQHVNKKGVVVFSDRPSEGAQSVEVEPIQTFHSPSVEKAKPEQAGQATEGEAVESATANQASTYALPEAVKYQVSIASPVNNEQIRSNNGTLSVVVNSKPDLQEGHQYRVRLDGRVAGAPQTHNVFKIPNTDRGEHTLSAEVIDKGGRVVKSSGSITVFLFRFSRNFKKG